MLRIAPNLCGTSYIITVSVCQSVSIGFFLPLTIALANICFGFLGAGEGFQRPTNIAPPCNIRDRQWYMFNQYIILRSCCWGKPLSRCKGSYDSFHCNILLRATEYIKKCDSGPAVGAEEASDMFWTSGGNYKPNSLLITSLRGWFCGARRRDQKGNSLIDKSWDIS